MKNGKYLFLKNSQRGASVLEVIFAIGLVVAVTPFIYNQVTEMTHVVHDVTVANQIMSTRDAVLNFMRTNQPNFVDNSNEISDEMLATIAPGAVKGMVYQTSFENSTNKNLETYLLFNIGDTKYRVSNIAKYIGVDAAAVGDDNWAYSRDWAVQLPESWSDELSSSDNYLVYRITRDFGGDDKTLYLHRGDLGDNLNQMHRALHMAGFDLVNVSDIVTETLNIRMVNSPFVKASTVITAAEIQFTRGAIMNNGTFNLDNLTGVTAFGFNSGVDAKQLCGMSVNERCNLGFFDISTPSIVINSDGLKANGTAEVYIKGFDTNGDLRAQNLNVDTISLMNRDLILFVSNEGDSDAMKEFFVLKLGDWTYTRRVQADTLPQGPKLGEIKLDAATTLNENDLAKSKSYNPYDGALKVRINWGKLNDPCFVDRYDVVPGNCVDNWGVHYE